MGKKSWSRVFARMILAILCVLQLTSFLFSARTAAAASAPNIINYQGRVLNANGIPVASSSVNMIFELYTAVSGGTCVWSNSSASCATATARSVSLTDGLFSESLGDTGSSYAAMSDAIFGDNGTLYLQITVGGEVLSPRKQIAAAPYALNSDTVDGLDADTDGATTSALVALNSSGNVVFTGDPTGSTVSTGVAYFNPAAAAADETIIGVGDNGTDRFRVDKEGDVFIKTIELDGVGSSNSTSGASLIGVYDELAITNATNVQDALDDLDQAIDSIVTGGAVSKWTDSGTFTYLTAVSDDLVLGDSTVAGASFFFDQSLGNLALGTDDALGGGLLLYSDGVGIPDVTLAADSTGNLDLTAAELTLTGNQTISGTLGVTGNSTLTGDIAVNGGDLTSSSATFNLLATASTTVNAFDAATTLNVNDAAITSTIDIGGVTNSGTNTINIATNSTAADVITIGNSNASSAVAITGGDDWSITGAGVLTLSASAAATTAIVATDTEYTNALSVGDNNIIGTTAAIDFTNFDVATTGNITVAAGVGLDTNGAGALAIGNTNATSVSVCNSATCDTLTLGNNADADTITIGDSLDTVSATSANWSITTAGLITTADDVAVNGGDFTSTSGTFNFLDASGNSTTLEIGGVTTDLANTISVATNSTSADTITIGNSNASSTVAITGGDDWSITGAGVLTLSASAAATTAVVATDTDYTNALSVGDNNIIGTTAAIDFTNFDVATTGAITVAAGTGLDTNGAGALGLGNTNATSVSVCNSAACDTLTLGNNADADTITIGDSLDTVSIAGANWSITTAGLITTADDVAINGGDLTSTAGTFNFLDAASNSANIDIGGVTTNLGNTINIATNSTTADVITIGNSNASSTVAITGGDDWSITTGGAASFTSLTNTGTSSFTDDVDMTFVTDGSQSENLNIGVTHATDANLTAELITFTDTAAADTGVNYLLGLVNANDGGATGTPDGIFAIQQADVNEAVADGIVFDVLAGGLTTAINATDAQIDTALSVGANDIVGTTGLINYTNFDVASTGAITVAAGTGLDTNGAGALGLGNTNATSVAVCDSAACDTLSLGSNADADAITIGDSLDTLSATSANWSITTAGLITTADDVALNGGDLSTTASTFNFLAANATTVNAFGAATTLNIADAATTTTIDIGGVTANGTTTVNIATQASSPDVVSIGSNHNGSSVAITGGDEWSMSAGGVLTFSASSATTTAIVATDTDYTNAFSIGDNNITGTTYSLVGTTSTIDFTNFDVASTGAITVAAGTGIDTNGAGALALGNTNATSVSECNSAACDTYTLGTNTDADTITIGESNDSVSIASTNWSITSGGAATFTSLTNTGLTTFTDDVDMTFVTDGTQSENLNIGVTHATDASLTPLVVTFTDTAAADTGTNYLVALVNADDGGAVGTPDGLFAIQTTETNELVADGIVFDVASGGLTTAINAADAQIDSALSIGANEITGTTGTINFTNFDVSTAGEVLVAATQGIDTNAAGALRLGQSNATSVGICNSSACDAISLGATTDADSILIGESNDNIAITEADWSISVAGLFTTGDDIALNGGDLTSSSSTFNLLATSSTTVNAFDAATTLNMNDAAVTSTIDIGGVTNSGTNTVNIATNSTAADVITIGNSNAATTVALTGGDDWSISGAGVLTLSASAAATTAIVVTDTDYTNALSVGDNNIIGTTAAIDFTNFDVATTGAITSADDIAINGGDFTSTSSTFNFLDAASNSTTLEIGGVTTDLGNTIRVATNSTTSDTLTFGNTNAATTVAITAGDDWSITGTGVLTLSASAAATTAIDITDTDYTNAVSIGDNKILGTTAAIDFSNFDVSTSGGITVAASAGLDTNATGTLALGNVNAATLSVCNSANCDTLNIATNTDADTINIGDENDTLVINAVGALVNDVTTTTSAFGVQAHGLTTGHVLTVASSGNAMTSGDLLLVTHAGTRTATGTISASDLSIVRSVTNNSAGLLTLSGDLIEITNNPTNTSGTLTDTADLLSLTQLNTSSSGAGLNVSQDGTGHAISVTNASTGSGLYVLQTGVTGTTVDSSTGGSVHISDTANTGYSFTIYNNTGSTADTPLTYILQDHIGFDQNVSVIQNDSNTTTSSGMVIIQNVVSDATTTPTSQALVIDVNESSNSDEVILVRSDADGTPDTEFRLENDGDLFADGAAYNSGADYAEFFYTVDSSLSGKQLVCQDLANNLAVKKCGLGDKTVVGVVSENPAFVGNNIPGAEGSLEGNPNYRTVGLEGQIDTYVTAADGAIAVGDPITASSVAAGYAGKATKPGRVVGFALQPLASGTGVIKVRVNPGWHGGDVIDSSGSVNSYTTTLALESLATATANTPVSNSNSLAFRGSAWNGTSAQAVAMTLSNKVTSANDYRLSVANNAGAEVAYINNLGDLVLSGKLYPSNQGTAQTSAYIYYDSNGVGYMRTNAAGWGTGSYDFAEMFPAPEVLAPGEVVVFGDAAEQVKRSTGKTYDDRIAGVVSTRPGFLAGTYKPGDSPIALSGRVPTKVNTENGAIAIGDPLTTSSTPGVAMKATTAGPIVGYAMQPFTGDAGMITVFIRASYYDGDGSAPALVTAPVSIVAQNSNLTSLNLSGGPISSVSSITGLGNTWKLAENGDLITRGRLVQIVKSHQNEDVETYAAASRQMTVQLSGTTTFENNTAIVRFEDIDPQFNDIIGTAAPYRVLATPSGVTGQVYVTDRSQNGFTVHAENAANGVLVDWLVIAYQKDYEPAVTPDPVVTEPVPEADPVIPPAPEPEVAGVTAEEPVVVPEEVPVTEPVVEEIVSTDPVAPAVSPDPAPTEPVTEVTP